ncbi:MAG TPA: ribonuclease P protein component [Methylophilaceae bacterium]|nr:ribonuclease P protein component [Methylophilaceae bacterium]
MNFNFPSRAKLTKTDDFSSVFNFRKRISGRYLAIHYRDNELAWPRLGLIVGKKTARLAVQRNYMKRVLRELFRTRQQQFRPVDLVIRPHKLFKHSDYPVIEQEFGELLVKIQRTSPPKITDKIS